MSGSLEHELRTHAGALRELARLLVGGQEAEDLVQDTALQALHRPPRRTDGLRGWLLGVLRHRASKHRRSEQRRQRRERAAPLPDPETTPQRIAEHKETMARLHAALLGLPEPYLGTLLLRFFEDLTPTQIAEQVAVPLATVKSRLQRGLALLRERLDAERGEWRRPMALAFGIDHALPEAAATVIGTGVIMASGMKVASAGLVGVLCVAAWWWLGAAQGERAREVADGSTGVAAAGPMHVPDRDGAAALAADPVARRAVETERAEPRPGYLRLRVLRAEDDAPLPATEVWYVDPDLAPLAPRRTQEQMDHQGHPFARLLGAGRSAMTDVHGEVDVPQTSFGTAVAAVAGDRSGFAVLAGTPPDGGHVLRMAVRPVLRVAVVHPDGQPAVGTPVAVIYGREGAADDVRLLGRTAGDGQLVVREPGSLKRNATSCWLGIAGLGQGGARVAFDPAAPPEARVVLRLPPTGSVQLVAHDGRQRPVTGEFEIGLYRLLDDGKVGPCSGFVATDCSGRAIVSFIGLGQRLRAWAARPEGWSVDFDGPARAGEIITAVLRPAHEGVSVSGRILTETGEPAAGMQFAVRGKMALAVGRTLELSTFVSTGPAGEFVFCSSSGVISEEDGVAAPGRELRGSLTAVGTRRSVDGRSAQFRITVPAGMKDHDAGTLHLVGAEVVMSGTVATTDGRPVDRARFDIDRQSGQGQALGGPDLQMAEEPPAPVQLDEDGGFVLFATDGASPRALLVTVPGCLSAKVPVVPGARDVRVVLSPACSLTVEVRYPAELRRLPIRAELAGAETMNILDDSGSARTGRWSALAPGNYRLAIWLLGGTEPLAERTVALATAGSGRSRREVFDVRGLQTAQVKVSSVTGEPVKAEGILLTAAGTEWHGRRAVDGFTVRDGSATVVTNAAAMSFDVIVAGYAIQHFSGPVQDVELRLQPLPEVAVQVAGLEELPAGCRVMLMASDVERADLAVRTEMSVGGFGPGLQVLWTTPLTGGAGSFKLCRPCRLQCTLDLWRGRKRQMVTLGEVSWSPGQERLSIDAAGDPLRAAIARLQ